MAERKIEPKFNIHKEYRRMNIGNPYRYGASSPEINLSVGNAASFITQKSDLSNRLVGVAESDISYFEIIGNDVKAFIDISYYVNTRAFEAKSITHFHDYDNLCTEFSTYGLASNSLPDGIKAEGLDTLELLCLNNAGITDAIFPSLTHIVGGALRLTNNLTGLVYFPIATSLSRSGYGSVFSKASKVYIASCQALGTDPSVVDGNFFKQCQQGVQIWIHPSMETVNGGQPHGQLQWAVTNKNAQITYGALPDNGDSLIPQWYKAI